MKRTLISALFVVATTCAFSQTKHLPAKVTIQLTTQEVLRIDSAVGYATLAIDSKNASKWFQQAFTTFYKQVQEQEVADSVKVKPKNK